MALIDKIKDIGYRNYPIDNHLLREENDFIKNGYFKLLALVLLQGGEASEGQRYLFERLIIGADADYKAEDYMRDAMNLEIDDYIEYTDTLKDHSVSTIKYRLLADAIILAFCDGNGDKETELIAAYMESVGITKEEAEYLCRLCRSILEQDGKRFVACELNALKGCDIAAFYTYADYFIKDKIYSDDNHIILYGSGKTLKPEIIFGDKEVTNSTIKITNTVIDLSEDAPVADNSTINILMDMAFHFVETGQYKIDLLHCGVLFENCTFVNDFRPINLRGMTAVAFQGCKFLNFRQSIIYAATSDCGVQFLDCEFENCYFKSEFRGHWAWLLDGDMTLDIDGCKFTHCGGLSDPNVIINNGSNSSVRNSVFKDCHGYYSDDKPDPDSKNSAPLFSDKAQNINNTLENSAKFC